MNDLYPTKTSPQRVLLINPPYERLKGLTVESIPMGLLSLATVLKGRGIASKVYDADTSFEQARFSYDNTERARTQAVYLENLQNPGLSLWEEIRGVVRDFQPDMVGLTLMTPAYSAFKKVLNILNDWKPRPVILAGGPHLTICKDQVLKDHPEIDFGFVGEAEETLAEFLEHYYSDRNFHGIKGLVYRREGRIIFNGERAFIPDLDVLPIPDRGLLHDEGRYRPAKLTQMMTSRGCPFECAFCASVPIWKRHVRRRSPRRLLEEVDYVLSRYHIRSFEFWDDTFTTSKKDVLEFCDLLCRKFTGRKPVWKCLTNINCMDEELLRAMKRAGCRQVSLGIESGSDRVLQLMKKKITTDQVRRAVRMLKRQGFWIDAFFMVGIPYETEDDICASINFIKELEPDTVNLCTFTPYVGTELYDRVVEKGFLKPGDYSVYDRIGHHSTFNYFMEHIPRERYQELLKEILQVSTEMTSRNSWRKMVLKMQKVTWEKVCYRLKQGWAPKRG